MLASCPECKGQVSDKASACPHCGCPLPSAQMQKHVSSGGPLRIRGTDKPSVGSRAERSRGRGRFASESKGGRWWLWIVLAGILLAVLGAVYEVFDHQRRLEEIRKGFSRETEEYERGQMRHEKFQELHEMKHNAPPNKWRAAVVKEGFTLCPACNMTGVLGSRKCGNCKGSGRYGALFCTRCRGNGVEGGWECATCNGIGFYDPER